MHGWPAGRRLLKTFVFRRSPAAGLVTAFSARNVSENRLLKPNLRKGTLISVFRRQPRRCETRRDQILDPDMTMIDEPKQPNYTPKATIAAEDASTSWIRRFRAHLLAVALFLFGLPVIYLGHWAGFGLLALVWVYVVVLWGRWWRADAKRAITTSDQRGRLSHEGGAGSAPDEPLLKWLQQHRSALLIWTAIMGSLVLISSDRWSTFSLLAVLTPFCLVALIRRRT